MDRNLIETTVQYLSGPQEIVFTGARSAFYLLTNLLLILAWTSQSEDNHVGDIGGALPLDSSILNQLPA